MVLNLTKTKMEIGYPSEIEKNNSGGAVKKTDKSKVTVLPQNLCLNPKRIQLIQRL